MISLYITMTLIRVLVGDLWYHCILQWVCVISLKGGVWANKTSFIPSFFYMIFSDSVVFFVFSLFVEMLFKNVSGLYILWNSRLILLIFI